MFGQRLAADVHPQGYTLKLTPDLKAATFAGDEWIAVRLDKPSKAITLNAIEIKFGKVTVTAAGGEEQTATVTTDEKVEQATFTVANELPAGVVKLHIEYTGMLNNELRGFYLSKTAKRNYAVTQFEATDARRAFPCFDEPAMKATYSVTLVIDKGDTAISNTNVIKDTPVGADKHAVEFATTPKMSTYLVAFLVGDFVCNSGESDGVPIRVCATPDKAQMGQFALTVAEYVLHYYDNYFGIKYPMPKLDLIALPDFEAGAMENFGAITYRETALLIDDKTASEDEKKNVSLVVAHEMAHQWFGDMVTMQWWDNLWLNEGFATWMEHKPIAAWKPQWNIPMDQATELNGVLNYDAGRITRAIRAKADTPAEINQMFDGITYGKGGAVLAMVENYLGEETFRQGVHNYLAAHMYGNATAEDFWNAQTQTSGKPVDKIMTSFVVQPGVPLLDFGARSGGKVQVAQQRFYVNPSPGATTAQTWTVPVCFKSDGGASCDLLTDAATQTASVPEFPYLFANASGKGYYRTVYTAADYQKLLTSVETGLTPIERIILIGNQWALMRSGRGNVSDYLDLASAVSADTNADVLDSIAYGTIGQNIANKDEREQLKAWIRKTYGPMYESMKTAGANDTDAQKQLREALFGMLGQADYPPVIAQAKEMAMQFLANPASVDPGLAHIAVQIASLHGDAALYDKVLEVSKTSNDPNVQTAALFDLSVFSDPALVKRTLDYVAAGSVRNQDSWILLVILMQRPETRDQAWAYIQANWDKIKTQLTTSSGARLVSSVGAFCDAKNREDAVVFFTKNPVPASDVSLKRATVQINDCIQLKEAQEPSLRQWLAKNAQ
jgi:aminopeptidase N/puromycin-sensitive aminopeptidase